MTQIEEQILKNQLVILQMMNIKWGWSYPETNIKETKKLLNDNQNQK